MRYRGTRGPTVPPNQKMKEVCKNEHLSLYRNLEQVVFVRERMLGFNQDTLEAQNRGEFVHKRMEFTVCT